MPVPDVTVTLDFEDRAQTLFARIFRMFPVVTTKLDDINKDIFIDLATLYGVTPAFVEDLFQTIWAEKARWK